MENNISSIISLEAFFEERLKIVNEQKVISDTDLAGLFEISVSELHELVRKNKKRLPPDFAFVTKTDNVKTLFFTLSGIVMMAGQMRSQKAIKLNIQLIGYLLKERPGFGFDAIQKQKNDF